MVRILRHRDQAGSRRTLTDLKRQPAAARGAGQIGRGAHGDPSGAVTPVGDQSAVKAAR